MWSCTLDGCWAAPDQPPTPPSPIVPFVPRNNTGARWAPALQDGWVLGRARGSSEPREAPGPRRRQLHQGPAAAFPPRSWASSSSPLPASSTSPCRRLRMAWKPLCPASPRPPTIPQTFREPPRPSSSRAMSDRSPARQGQGPPGSASPELCLISRRKG